MKQFLILSIVFLLTVVFVPHAFALDELQEVPDLPVIQVSLPPLSLTPSEATPTPCVEQDGEFPVEVPCPTPTPTDPTPTPTAPPADHGDGLSDGKSSCPDCTKAPVVPAAPPSTGRG